MTDAPKPQKPAKPPKAPFKPAFDVNQLINKIQKMNQNQLAMVAAAVFFVGYALYTFVLTPSTAPMMSDGVNTPLQQSTAETAEQQFKRENKNATLPDGSKIPANVVAERTQMTQQVPFGDKELEFRVRLPKNWVMSEFARYGLPGQEDYTVLTNIARYFGPAIEDARPFVWVEVEKIKRYMTAETWARAYMIKQGIAPEAIQVKSTTDVQALYVSTRDTQSYAVRSLFRIEGDTMVFVSFGVPVHYYKDFKDIMGLSMNSFSLVKPIDRHIEEIKEYKLLNIVRFDYYASWLPKNEFLESTLRPSIELFNPQETRNPKGDLLQGLIMVNAWRKVPQFSPEQNISEIRDRLQELRLVLKDPVGKVENLPLHDNFISITQTPYLAQVKTYVRTDQFDIIKSDESATNQEVWVTVLDNDYYRLYLTLVTPIKATNYVIWAQNMAAYELLIKTAFLRASPVTGPDPTYNADGQ